MEAPSIKQRNALFPSLKWGGDTTAHPRRFSPELAPASFSSVQDTVGSTERCSKAIKTGSQVPPDLTTVLSPTHHSELWALKRV